MTENEFYELQKKLSENKLFRQSTSIHRFMQYQQFSMNGQLLNGQQLRMEDEEGHLEEDENFNPLTKRIVIFNFENGTLSSDGDSPAIEYPNHWEFWKNGEIIRVRDGITCTVEYWEKGVPVKIERY